jgi:hypothetical protein
LISNRLKDAHTKKSARRARHHRHFGWTAYYYRKQKKQREIFPFETNKLTVTREAQRGEGDRCFESIIGRETDEYSGPSGLCRAGKRNCYSTTLQIFTIL